MTAVPTTVAHLHTSADRLAEERLLRAIADQSRDILLVLRADGTVMYSSLHVERVLGYAREGLVGRQAFDYVHPEDRAMMAERLALLLADPSHSGQTRSEFRLRHEDGSWCWFESVAANLLADPTVGGILLNARDITDRKRTEMQLDLAKEALRQSELRYRTVVEFTPGFVQECEITPDGQMRMRWVSEGFEDVFGVSVGQFAACGGWQKFAHPDEHAGVKKRLQELLRGEQTEAEIRIVDAHGNERWLLTINRPVGALPDGGITTVGVVYDISKRKRTELELLASNARRAAILEVALDCIIVMNQEGRIIEFNPAAERTFRYRREQVMGTPLRDVIVPARYREAHMAGLARYLASGEMRMMGKRIEITGMRAGGEEFPLELEITPVRLGAESVFTAYLRDITERRLFEQRLRANEALLRAVTDSVPDRLLMLDLQMRVQFSNRSVQGVAPGELVGRDALDLVPAADRAAAQAVYQRVIESRAPQVFEFRDVVRGETRWFENRVGPVIDDGRIMGLTVASSEITSRRRNEEALRTQAQILDTMREGVLVLDSRRNIKVVNTAMARLTGYQPRELIGRPGVMLTRRSATEYAAVGSELMRRVEAEGFCELEYECLRRDGTSFMAAVVLTPIEIGGEPHLLSVVEDITQRRVLEREIIEIANREQRRIGNDLHDGLGQELTGIALMLRGLTGRLSKDGDAACADAEEIVGLVNKAIEGTRQLARGLSPVSIERGGLPFALRALATRATDMYACNVRFRSKIWPQLTLDASASNHLYRIAQEAITNAVRHGHATEVMVDLQAASQEVTLTVSDNGRGLAPGVELAQGMGLRIMRYRAHIVGGNVEVGAGAEGGVRVTLNCPQPLLGETTAQQGVSS